MVRYEKPSRLDIGINPAADNVITGCEFAMLPTPDILFRKALATRRALRALAWRLTNTDFLIVFNWHQVTPLFDPVFHHKYTWTSLGVFEAELDYISTKFEVLSLHEAIRRFNCGTLKGSCAALTFDDGDISIAEYVFPTLSRRTLPATFFINSAYLDSRRSYWFPILCYLSAVEDAKIRSLLPDSLKERAMQLRTTDDPFLYREIRERVEKLVSVLPNLETRLISARWLADLNYDQFSIGAHGHEHQRFSMMSAEWQRSDLRENVGILSQFKAYRPVFAVPFGRPGDWTKETISIARDQGLELVLADGGINVTPGDTYRRIPSDGRVIRHLVSEAMSDAMSK